MPLGKNDIAKGRRVFQEKHAEFVYLRNNFSVKWDAMCCAWPASPPAKKIYVKYSTCTVCSWFCSLLSWPTSWYVCLVHNVREKISRFESSYDPKSTAWLNPWCVIIPGSWYRDITRAGFRRPCVRPNWHGACLGILFWFWMEIESQSVATTPCAAPPINPPNECMLTCAIKLLALGNGSIDKILLAVVTALVCDVSSTLFDTIWAGMKLSTIAPYISNTTMPKIVFFTRPTMHCHNTFKSEIYRKWE